MIFLVVIIIIMILAVLEIPKYVTQGQRKVSTKM